MIASETKRDSINLEMTLKSVITCKAMFTIYLTAFRTLILIIYFCLSGFHSSLLLIYFCDGPNQRVFILNQSVAQYLSDR